VCEVYIRNEVELSSFRIWWMFNVPEDELVRSKRVIEVTFIKKRDNIAHQQSTSTTRNCTFTTVPVN
jgi:hypothetical protein